MRARSQQSATRAGPLLMARASWRRRLWRRVWALAYLASRPLRWLARRIRALPHVLLSVRMRLALWYLAILAVVFFVFGGIVYSATVRNADSQQQAALASISQQLLQTYDPATGMLNITDPFTDGFSPQARKATAPVAKGAPIPLGPDDVAVLFDARDNITQRLGPISLQGATDLQDIVRLRQDKFASAPETVEFQTKVTLLDGKGGYSAQPLVVYLTSFTANGRSAGTLVIGQSPLASATLQNLIPGLLLAGPLTLLVAALGGYWVASRAMRPVRLITRAAQGIEETDLSRRLRLTRRDELGELASTFDHMLDRLEAAFDRQRQFTADASHELRTPLSVVNLEVTRGLAARRAPEEYERILAAVRAENAHMSCLVDDLLTLARADAGQAQWQMETLDLSDVALEALERLAPLARERGVELAAGALPELRVLGDRLALTRLFVNLIENGVKYAGGPGGRVTLATGGEWTAEDGAGWAWARVSDNGPGIAAEHLPHLFERFYRVDIARARSDASSGTDGEASGGSGLGLAIARWVAEAHGGSVNVRSAVGQGATVELRLPLLAGSAREVAARAWQC